MSYLHRVKIVSGGTTTYHNLTKFLYGTCSTGAGTAAKVVTCADMGALEDGVTVFVKFTNGNTVAEPTLNVNNTGAKAIYYDSSERPGASDTPWTAGSVVAFTYNGTNWILASAASQSGNTKVITFTVPAGSTEYTVTDSWITADTIVFSHNLDSISTLRSTVIWSTIDGSLFLNFDIATSENMTFKFGLIKPDIIA